MAGKISIAPAAKWINTNVFSLLQERCAPGERVARASRWLLLAVLQPHWYKGYECADNPWEPCDHRTCTRPWQTAPFVSLCYTIVNVQRSASKLFPRGPVRGFAPPGSLSGNRCLHSKKHMAECLHTIINKRDNPD